MITAGISIGCKDTLCTNDRGRMGEPEVMKIAFTITLGEKM